MDTIAEQKPVPVAEEKAIVDDTVDLVMYNTGETILVEGDSSQHACQLVSGTAKVIRQGDVVATINSGDYFGAIAALTNNRRSAAVVASQLCVVRTISKHKFRLLIQTNPEILNNLY